VRVRREGWRASVNRRVRQVGSAFAVTVAFFALFGLIFLKTRISGTPP
jgi:hypothetical protein